MRTAALVLAVAATLAAAGSVPPAESAVSSAFVRVNQVGYPTTGAKRAYLMSSVNQAGATFTVRSTSGATVTGTAGPSLGAWSNTYGFVHPLDFDAARTSTQPRSRTACPSTRRNATARATSRTRCAPRPHISTTRAR